jgi:hypothetical protein
MRQRYTLYVCEYGGGSCVAIATGSLKYCERVLIEEAPLLANVYLAMIALD